MSHIFKRLSLSILITALTLSAQFSTNQIEIHGFLSQGYAYTVNINNLSMDTKNGTFEINEAAINFSTDITDRLRGGLQFLSRDLGKVGNNIVMLDWAYADYHWRDYLGVRIGKIKTPLALYNEVRDVDALRTFVFLPQAVYDENIRDFSFGFQGAAFYGNIALNQWGDIDYNLYLGTFNIPDPNNGFWNNAFTDMSNLASPLIASDSVNIGQMVVTDPEIRVPYLWGGSAYWTTIPGLKIGGCYLYTDQLMATDLTAFSQVTHSDGSVTNESQRLHFDVDVTMDDYYTLSAEYTINNMTLTAEFHNRTYQVIIPKGTFFNFNIAMNRQLQGYYGQATYRISDWLEAGSYYSVYKDYIGMDNDKPSWQIEQNDLCAALRFDVTPSWLFKLEAHRMDGTGLVLNVENPSGLKVNWNLVAIKSSINF